MSEGHIHQRISLKEESTPTGEPRLAILGEHFNGPIPPPHLLQEYERILPGAAERIFKMAEQEQQHRHAIISKHMHTASKQEANNAKLAFTGQGCAITIALAGIAASTWLIHHDKDIAGLGTLLTSLAPLIGAFIVIQKKKPDEAETAPPQSQE